MSTACGKSSRVNSAASNSAKPSPSSVSVVLTRKGRISIRFASGGRLARVPAQGGGVPSGHWPPSPVAVTRNTSDRVRTGARMAYSTIFGAMASTQASWRERAALVLVQIGVVLVVLIALPYKTFDLDRFFVPKELVLHAT